MQTGQVQYLQHTNADKKKCANGAGSARPGVIQYDWRYEAMPRVLPNTEEKSMPSMLNSHFLFKCIIIKFQFNSLCLLQCDVMPFLCINNN